MRIGCRHECDRSTSLKRIPSHHNTQSGRGPQPRRGDPLGPGLRPGGLGHLAAAASLCGRRGGGCSASGSGSGSGSGSSGGTGNGAAIQAGGGRLQQPQRAHGHPHAPVAVRAGKRHSAGGGGGVGVGVGGPSRPPGAVLRVRSGLLRLALGIGWLLPSPSNDQQ